MEIELIKKIKVSEENISDLLITAFEGGINYWCGYVEIKSPEKFEGLYASDVLTKGADLILYDNETDDKWVLNLDLFLKGLIKVIEIDGYSDMDELIDNHDVETVDRIIQYALFDKIVFG